MAAPVSCGGRGVRPDRHPGVCPGGPAAVVGQQPRARSDSNGVSAGPVGYGVAGYGGTVAAGRVPDRRRGWPAAGGLNWARKY